MKNLLIIIFILCSFFTYSQDLYVEYLDNDQKKDRIKTVLVTNENGTIKEKKFPAKSHIHLIKLFENKGYKVNNIQVTKFNNNETHKYHIWFDKIELKNLN